MTVATINHVVIDDKGVARIAGSRSRVIDVVLDARAYGWSPQQIREQHPHLSLAQIHAAFAYYYDHQTDLDAEIEQQLREVDATRAAAGESAFAKRMRAEGKLKCVSDRAQGAA